MEYLSDKSSVAKMDKNLEKISPFELKNRLIEMADESVKKMAHVMLNAGRGNPNWIATEAREAFFILGSFAIAESRRVMDMSEGIAGIPQKEGIAQRFELWLKTHEGEPGIGLLKRTYNYMLMEHAVDPDSLVHEWAESMAGNQYPMPDRILKYTEILVRDYLNREMCDGRPPQGNFDLFATEGGTAGMCYVFPLILPITKGNVVKTFIIGFVVLAIGLYFVTDLAPYFTKAAHDVYAKTQDAAVNIPSGFEGGALDFASSPFSWAIFHLTYSFKWIGSGILVLITLFLMVLNRRSIIKYQKTMKN